MDMESSLASAIRLIRKITPDLTKPDLFYKGCCGRIVVVGGSQAYTGAPYYAATAALRLGADIAFVVCAPEASIPIKSYSPELIVLPLLDSACSAIDIVDAICKQTRIDAVDALIIGPGLDPSEHVGSVTREILKRTRLFSTPIVLDAVAISHGLNFLIDDEKPTGIFVATPNTGECNRYKDLFVNLDGMSYDTVAILQKGSTDKITCSANSFNYQTLGSPRRYGGQGDILAGVLATLLGWLNNRRYKSTEKETHISNIDLVDVCTAACHVTRVAGLMAYRKGGRSTNASQHLEYLEAALETCFESTVEEKK